MVGKRANQGGRVNTSLLNLANTLGTVRASLPLNTEPKKDKYGAGSLSLSDVMSGNTGADTHGLSLSDVFNSQGNNALPVSLADTYNLNTNMSTNFDTRTKPHTPITLGTIASGIGSALSKVGSFIEKKPNIVPAVISTTATIGAMRNNPVGRPTPAQTQEATTISEIPAVINQMPTTGYTDEEKQAMLQAILEQRRRYEQQQIAQQEKALAERGIFAPQIISGMKEKLAVSGAEQQAEMARTVQLASIEAKRQQIKDKINALIQLAQAQGTLGSQQYQQQLQQYQNKYNMWSNLASIWTQAFAQNRSNTQVAQALSNGT